MPSNTTSQIARCTYSCMKDHNPSSSVTGIICFCRCEMQLFGELEPYLSLSLLLSLAVTNLNKQANPTHQNNKPITWGHAVTESVARESGRFPEESGGDRKKRRQRQISPESADAASACSIPGPWHLALLIMPELRSAFPGFRVSWWLSGSFPSHSVLFVSSDSEERLTSCSVWSTYCRANKMGVKP